MPIFKVALIQMQTGLEREENLAKAEDLITVAAGQGADIAVLPEMFPIPYMTEWMRSSMEAADGETVTMLRNVAGMNNINILGGSFPEEGPEKHCYNTSLFIDRSGEIVATHRKLHLFDAVIGGVIHAESDVVAAGDSVTVFDGEFGKMGIAICYDIRFPELFLHMAGKGARVIFVPAVFTQVTGQAHWELLVRTRAIDNQLFICACSAASAPTLPFDPYGHSMVVDPWGKVLGRAGRGEDIVYVDIDTDEVDRVREKLPVTSARRPDLYR